MGDREVIVRLRADISQYQRQLATAAADTQAFGRATDQVNGPLSRTESQSKRTGNEIDKLSGRLRLATDAALVLGPALVPLGAAAVGGVVALSAELGALAGGLGVTLLAVNGLGDGLKALDAYQLEPTAANLEKLNQQMEALGPSGEHFVRFLDGIEPELKSLQTAARDGLLPGAEEGIDALLDRLPELRKLIGAIATEVGDLTSGGGKAIGGKGFDKFFNYLKTDGIKILDDTGKTIGNLAETVANLFAAFGGLSSDFSGGLLKFSQGLAEASANLDSSAGFQEFIRYVETEGPHALEALGAIADMFLQIVEATAPLGGPVLTALTALAKVIGTIADSDLGTPLFAGLAALALFNRSVLLTQKLNSATFGGPGVGILKGYSAGLGQVITAQDRATMSAKELAAAEAQQNKNLAGLAKAGKGAALIGGLALANSGLADKVGLSNTANLALMGTIAGPWGAAIGGGIGVLLDYKDANGKAAESIQVFQAALAASQGDIKAQQDAIDGLRAASAAAADDVDANSIGEALKNQFDPDTAVAFYRSVLGMKTGADQMSDAADQAQEHLDNLARGSAGTSFTLGQLADRFQETADAAEDQANAIQDSVDAMRAQRQEALRALDAELNYQAAIDDASKSIKENGRNFDITTEKGRANRQALYALADGWNQQSDAAKNAKGSLQAARQNFIETATQMGATAAQAKRLADRLFEIPPKRKTEITVETSQADAALRALKARMDQIKDKTVHINVVGGPHAGGQTATDEQVPNGKPSAGGSTVPKGGAYRDRYHYLLAPGEEVISNRFGQADRNRGLLKAINAGRMADGGTSGGGHGSRPYTLFTSGSDVTSQIIGSAHGLAQALKMLQAALAKSEKSLDKERSSRDDLQSQFDSIASTVGGAYSSMDPFAAPQSSGSVWSAGGGAGNALGSFDAAVAGNTASTQAAQTALAFAQSHGLDGPLYAALAASGNLPLLQQFAQLSAAEIDTREQAFAAQSNAQSALGGMAANAEVGAQLAKANERLDKQIIEVKGLRHDVREMDRNNVAAQKQNAKDVKDGVNGAAGSGHKRGHH